MFDPSVVWKRASGVGWTQEGSVVFVALPAPSSPFAVIRFADTGATIWDLIDGQRTLGEITEETARMWDAAEADVSASVASFVESLHSNGVLERSTD